MQTPKRRASDKSFYGSLGIRIRHSRRLMHLTQAGLARAMKVGASAVAQWENPRGTSPTVNHLIQIANITGVSFEWLATGRGQVALDVLDSRADNPDRSIDQIEERMLLAFRRIVRRKRVTFVAWMEDFL